MGGDFNVGETDAGKNGVDLADDRTDGYDDTHALMTRGLVDGLRLRSLTREMGNTDDDTPGDDVFPYPGVGAIDVLSVGGAGSMVGGADGSQAALRFGGLNSRTSIDESRWRHEFYLGAAAEFEAFDFATFSTPSCD